MGESLKSGGGGSSCPGGAKSNPISYGIIDSQSAKTTYASDERGIDGGEKIENAYRYIDNAVVVVRRKKSVFEFVFTPKLQAAKCIFIWVGSFCCLPDK